MLCLRVTSGPLAGSEVEVVSELIIGRESADVTIADDEISRRHTVVRPIADELEVDDLGSTNGTFVDGRRIAGRTRVGAGATISLGTTVLTVAAVASPSRASADQPQAAMGQFDPPGRRGRRGLASRSWVPVALAFGTVVCTGVALVVYFAAQ